MTWTRQRRPGERDNRLSPATRTTAGRSARATYAASHVVSFWRSSQQRVSSCRCGIRCSGSAKRPATARSTRRVSSCPAMICRRQTEATSRSIRSGVASLVTRAPAGVVAVRVVVGEAGGQDAGINDGHDPPGGSRSPSLLALSPALPPARSRTSSTGAQMPLGSTWFAGTPAVIDELSPRWRSTAWVCSGTSLICVRGTAPFRNRTRNPPVSGRRLFYERRALAAMGPATHPRKPRVSVEDPPSAIVTGQRSRTHGAWYRC